MCQTKSKHASVCVGGALVIDNQQVPSCNQSRAEESAVVATEV